MALPYWQVALGRVRSKFEALIDSDAPRLYVARADAIQSDCPTDLLKEMKSEDGPLRRPRALDTAHAPVKGVKTSE